MGTFNIVGAGLTIGNIIELFVRMVLAAICGGLVGMERSRRFKDAGVRTHSLVGCAAALMMIISKYAFLDIADAASKGADPARIAAQIVTGVSFLGAGIIYRDKQQHSLRGLTTAAGIWGVAGIGMAMGAGLYLIALFATLFIIFLQLTMHRFAVGRDRYNTAKLQVEIKDDPAAVDRMNARLSEWGVMLSDSTVVREDGKLSYDMDVKMVARDIKKEINQYITEDQDVFSVRLRDII